MKKSANNSSSSSSRGAKRDRTRDHEVSSQPVEEREREEETEIDSFLRDRDDLDLVDHHRASKKSRALLRSLDTNQFNLFNNHLDMDVMSTLNNQHGNSKAPQLKDEKIRSMFKTYDTSYGVTVEEIRAIK